MNLINTKLHGAFDYVFAVFLIASPWILGYAHNNTSAPWIAVFLGTVIIVLSVCTNYELGAFKLLNMSTHLLLDGMIGIVLALSPWIFQFYGTMYKPQFLMGGFLLLVTALSSRHAYQGLRDRVNVEDHTNEEAPGKAA